MQSGLTGERHAVHVGKVQKKRKKEQRKRPCKAVSPARDMRCTSASTKKMKKSTKKKTMQCGLAGARHAVHVGRVHEEGFDDFALSCFP
jgi:transcription elongation factor Elf1